jgi:acetoin utilization protein AcuB
MIKKEVEPMRVQDIMQRNVKTIAPNVSIVMANDIMWRQRIHHLVVQDEKNIILGIISDTDLGGPDASEIRDDVQVKDVMVRSVITAEPTMTVKRAAAIIRERGIHCLPIVEDGKLVGIITSTDLERLEKQGVLQHTAFHGIEHQA